MYERYHLYINNTVPFLRCMFYLYLCQLKQLTMNTDNMIPIDSQLENFKQYLDNNRRCILSSRFGNGKSYFLSNFIEKNSENYLFIPI